MCSNDRDQCIEAVAALGAAMARCVIKLRPHGVLTGRDCLALLEGIEVVSRQLPAVQHDLISALDGLAGPAELGGTARSGRRPRPSCGCTTTGRSA